MEWANGDVRINLAARDSPFSRIPERGDQATGVARGEYPAKTHLSMSGPQPPREEFKVNPTFYQRTAPATYGIVHPDYKISGKRFCEPPPLAAYQLERQDEQHGSVEYPSLPRGFTAVSSGYTAPSSDDSCSQVCTECPGGGAPCDYGPSESGYPMVELRSSCLPPEHADTYTMEIGVTGASVSSVPNVVVPTATADNRSVQSHVSHCDIRDFEEYRGLRGSRESLGSLPPDLQRHLQNCRCQCDHLGYGNYQVSYLKIK